ncbi:hypothetical protein Rs2_01244 [Raphanus sativus]|nr:hypothetical protein Rs2_01244 [Raphanus sativus]
MGHQSCGALTLWNYPIWMRNLVAQDIDGEDRPNLIDMAALEFYRDRERGVPRYNGFRKNLLMSPISKWEDLTDDEEAIKLKAVLQYYWLLQSVQCRTTSFVSIFSLLCRVQSDRCLFTCLCGLYVCILKAHLIVGETCLSLWHFVHFKFHHQVCLCLCLRSRTRFCSCLFFFFPHLSLLSSSVYKGNIDKLDLNVGLHAEKMIKGFAISETAFFIFLLVASRRLEADMFFTTNFNEKTYTKEGLEWVNATESLKDVIDRA